MGDHKVSIDVSDLASEINEAIIEFKAEIESILYYSEDFIKVEVETEESESKEDTPKFKVGDVITGKEKNEYYVTNNQSVLIVTEIESKYLIKVKVMDHKELDDEIGEEYEVDPKDFKLITDILWESD